MSGFVPICLIINRRFTESLHQVSYHDDARTTLVKEIKMVFGDYVPTVEVIPSVEYTGNVIKETIAVLPTVPRALTNSDGERHDRQVLDSGGNKTDDPLCSSFADDRWWDDPRTF